MRPSPLWNASYHVSRQNLTLILCFVNRAEKTEVLSDDLLQVSVTFLLSAVQFHLQTQIAVLNNDSHYMKQHYNDHLVTFHQGHYHVCHWAGWLHRCTPGPLWLSTQERTQNAKQVNVWKNGNIYRKWIQMSVLAWFSDMNWTWPFIDFARIGHGHAAINRKRWVGGLVCCLQKMWCGSSKTPNWCGAAPGAESSCLIGPRSEHICLRHLFQVSLSAFQTKTKPRSFQTETGSAASL